ncbi:MAG: glycosyltransferase [Bacteroidia bacterium]|nr:glycosyltransferase [Bacteroidia bacterium]
MIEISGFSFSVAELALLFGFVLMFLIQLFYQLLMATFVLSGKKKVKQVDFPSVSIIIPSRNYEENLRELIPMLLEQDYPDFEVVVVDDCSSDGTEWYLAELKLQSNKLKTSRIIQETDFPNALAITIGVRAASKEWLVFLNPLCRVTSNNWLKSLAEELLPEIEAVFGFVKYTNLAGSMQKFIRYENFDSFILYGSARYLGLAMPISDMNIAYKREQFLNRRGFAAVLDSPFSENELYLNKISSRQNSVYLLNNSTSVTYAGDADWYDGMNFKKKQLLLRRKFTIGQSAYLWINTISRLVFDISMIALLILSPLRFWVAGIWVFKIIHELIWGIVAMKRLGEKNIFPGLIIFRSIIPLFNSIISLNQFFAGQKRKWK